jgi:hypothetical protein
MSVKNKLPAIQATDQTEDHVDKWFTEFIDHLKVDHLLIKEKIAPKEKAYFYNAMIFGDHEVLLSQMRATSTQAFVKSLIYDYLRELKENKTHPLKLAIGLSDSKILVWSEIEDDDEMTEDALLIAEAKVNGKYQAKGFYINSTIIEKSDSMEVPPHYQPII